jgi:recombination protein RecR
MNTISKLAELLNEFPGIGPRQAKRLVYFLLTKNPAFHRELSEALTTLSKSVSVCPSCFRYFTKNGESLCNICGDKNRTDGTLMIVEKDVDFENIERSKVYDGKYFILGGTVSALDKKPEEKVRLRELAAIVEERGKSGVLKEIIFALSANADGEETGEFVNEILREAIAQFGIQVSLFGRGLSTGSELEYADSETIKNAFKNRK